MNILCPDFRWPRFLLAFISAPLLVTLVSFWLWVPLYALMLGGPLYLIAGLPLAAWFLQRKPRGWVEVLLLGLLCQLLQIPIFVIVAASTGSWDILDALPAFLSMGALFAFLWTGTFLILYHLLARAELSDQQKEPHHVQS